MYIKATKVTTGQALFRGMNSFAWFGPLCIFIHELPVSAHLKNYLNQDYLVDNTWVSFSAFPWDSRCLWLLLNYRNNSSCFLYLSYFSLPSFSLILCFQPMGLCFKWQFIPFVRSATLNINFLTEHTLRPNRRNKISAIYCATPPLPISRTAIYHWNLHQSSTHSTTREPLHNNADAIWLPLKTFYTYCKTVTIPRPFEFLQEALVL